MNNSHFDMGFKSLQTFMAFNMDWDYIIVDIGLSEANYIFIRSVFPHVEIQKRVPFDKPGYSINCVVKLESILENFKKYDLVAMLDADAVTIRDISEDVDKFIKSEKFLNLIPGFNVGFSMFMKSGYILIEKSLEILKKFGPMLLMKEETALNIVFYMCNSMDKILWMEPHTHFFIPWMINSPNVHDVREGFLYYKDKKCAVVHTGFHGQFLRYDGEFEKIDDPVKKNLIGFVRYFKILEGDVCQKN